jgi:uncharacterized protein (TIGR02996 family)
MMLAAKLSWLLRSYRRRPCGSASVPEWKGEPKDLYDVHLLLTKADLRADVFQKSLMAVGRGDQLDWNNLQAIFDIRLVKMKDANFPNWGEFRERYKTLITSGPAELLQTIADRLEPLLGDFYLREEMPFLLAINSNPVDESIFLVYSAWLDERGEQRCHLLRLLARFLFCAEHLSREELTRTRKALQVAFHATSVPWLLQMFGTSARFEEMKRRIEDQSC